MVRSVFCQVLCITKATLLLLPLLGCEHAAPFGAESYGSNQPFQAGSPHRLTYNPGQDRAPAWLPDESGIVYSLERTDRADRDRCLGVLPPDGGQLVREICYRTATADDSTDVLTEPAPRADGWVAYLLVHSGVGATAPSSVTLVMAQLANSGVVRFLQAFPYLTPDAVRYDEASQLRWLDPTTLVYVAQEVGHKGRRSADTVRTGGALVQLDVGLAPDVVGGTPEASSVAVGASGDVLYFTLGGDARVFRRNLATGMDSTLFDFGVSGIARDIQVVGSRLVAVVGGHVAFAFDSILNYWAQNDSGGPLHVVDLLTGADTILGAPDAAFRRPALSPSGKRLVVEASVNGTSDLWEFILP